VDHGIARYAGLGRPKGGSHNRDFMILEFQRGDRLFVPADRLDLVQKYSGVGGHKPPLDRLGGHRLGEGQVTRPHVGRVDGEGALELYARRRRPRATRSRRMGHGRPSSEAAFPSS
jgi:transcription-repair coupling factor (superfamily II helicase)